MTTMKAAVIREAGGPEVLKIGESEDFMRTPLED